MSVEQIRAAAMKLPVGERTAVVEMLAPTVGDEIWSYDISKQEISHRLADVLSGTADLVPVEQAMGELEARYCLVK